MNKEVIVTVVGVQRDEAGEETRIVQQLPGEFHEKENAIFLFYQEKDRETGAITQNSLKFKDGVLTYTRKGSVNARMVFTPDENYITAYQSPFGLLHLEIHTRELAHVIGPHNGTIRVSYELYSDGAFVSSNELTLNIRNK